MSIAVFALILFSDPSLVQLIEPLRPGVLIRFTAQPEFGVRTEADFRTDRTDPSGVRNYAVSVRDGAQTYELTSESCPAIRKVISDLGKVEPPSFDGAGDGLTRGIIQTGGVTYAVVSDATSSDGGHYRMALTTNNGSLARWGRQTVQVLSDCKSR